MKSWRTKGYHYPESLIWHLNYKWIQYYLCNCSKSTIVNDIHFMESILYFLYAKKTHFFIWNHRGTRRKNISFHVKSVTNHMSYSHIQEICAQFFLWAVTELIPKYRAISSCYVILKLEESTQPPRKAIAERKQTPYSISNTLLNQHEVSKTL